MKSLTLTIILMNATLLAAQNGQAITIKKTFSRQTQVSIDIHADAPIVWALLTNATDYPRWNSTIVTLKGEIKLGEKLRLVSTLDESRTFKLKVKEMVTEERLTWGDGKGNRIYTLTPIDQGIRFTMDEKIGGLMFPMYAKFIPPFDEAFEQFAADLKKEAETIAKAEQGHP